MPNQASDVGADRSRTASFGADLEGQIRPLAKHMRAVMIENCGHYLAEEQPECLLEELERFLRENA